MITIKLAQESAHRNKQLHLFLFQLKKGATANADQLSNL
jgi:hypothetical protein